MPDFCKIHTFIYVLTKSPPPDRIVSSVHTLTLRGCSNVIHASVYQVVSSLQFFRLISCMHLSSAVCVLHVSPISSDVSLAVLSIASEAVKTDMVGPGTAPFTKTSATGTTKELFRSVSDWGSTLGLSERECGIIGGTNGRVTLLSATAD